MLRYGESYFYYICDYQLPIAASILTFISYSVKTFVRAKKKTVSKLLATDSQNKSYFSSFSFSRTAANKKHEQTVK